MANIDPSKLTPEAIDALLAAGAISDTQAKDLHRRMSGKLAHGATAVAEPPKTTAKPKVTNLDGDMPTDAKSIKFREHGANVPVHGTELGFKVYGSEKTTRGARIVPVTYSPGGKSVAARSLSADHVVALSDAKVSKRVADAIDAINAAWLIGPYRPAGAPDVVSVGGDSDITF